MCGNFNQHKGKKMTTFEMKSERHIAATNIEAIVLSAGRENRALTDGDQRELVRLRSTVNDLDAAIAARGESSLVTMARERGHASLFTGGTHGPANAGEFARTQASTISPDTFRPEYMEALHAFIQTGGKAHGGELTSGSDGAGGYHIPGSERYTRQRAANGSFPGTSAAMYEGAGGSSTSNGGYAVSIPTVPLIVPLALPDLGIYDASMVISTSNDVKIPQQTSFGTATVKAESNGTIATFGGTDPALGQIELSAYMAGGLRLVSWELIQDATQFQEFVVSDLLNAQRIFEGSMLATGTGTGQPQGLFVAGNVGNGTGAPYALTGTASDAALLLNSLFDVTATLKGAYQGNASWVMSRATGQAIRRAQMQTNLFAQIATVDADGTERILGRPVYYDLNAPALPTATNAGVSSILYGDFRAGNLIGVRGGGGINVKILDQPWAAQGQLGILAYRRLDARVRRSEAIQAITFSHS